MLQSAFKLLDPSKADGFVFQHRSPFDITYQRIVTTSLRISHCQIAHCSDFQREIISSLISKFQIAEKLSSKKPRIFDKCYSRRTRFRITGVQ